MLCMQTTPSNHTNNCLCAVKKKVKTALQLKGQGRSRATPIKGPIYVAPGSVAAGHEMVMELSWPER